MVFLVLSVLLIAAVYSSSITGVFADTRTAFCDKGRFISNCVVNNSESNNLELWKCVKNIDGKTWRCDQAKLIRKPSTTHDALDLGLQMQNPEGFGRLMNANTTTYDHPSDFVTMLNQTMLNQTATSNTIYPPK